MIMPPKPCSGLTVPGGIGRSRSLGATKNTPATFFTTSGCSKDHFITSVVPALCGTSTTGFGARST